MDLEETGHFDIVRYRLLQGGQRETDLRSPYLELDARYEHKKNSRAVARFIEDQKPTPFYARYIDPYGGEV